MLGLFLNGGYHASEVLYRTVLSTEAVSNEGDREYPSHNLVVTTPNRGAPATPARGGVTAVEVGLSTPRPTIGRVRGVQLPHALDLILKAEALIGDAKVLQQNQQNCIRNLASTLTSAHYNGYLISKVVAVAVYYLATPKDGGWIATPLNFVMRSLCAFWVGKVFETHAPHYLFYHSMIGATLKGRGDQPLPFNLDSLVLGTDDPFWKMAVSVDKELKSGKGLSSEFQSFCRLVQKDLARYVNRVAITYGQSLVNRVTSMFELPPWLRFNLPRVNISNILQAGVF